MIVRVLCSSSSSFVLHIPESITHNSAQQKYMCYSGSHYRNRQVVVYFKNFVQLQMTTDNITLTCVTISLLLTIFVCFVTHFMCILLHNERQFRATQYYMLRQIYSRIVINNWMNADISERPHAHTSSNVMETTV